MKKIVKYILLVMSILCILLRVHHEYLFPFNLDDKIIQIGTAQSLLKGFGIGFTYADPVDFSKNIFTFHGNFPPAYPLLIAPFLLVFQNPFWADLCLQLIVISLFFYSFYRLSLLLKNEISTYAILLLFCFWAVSNSPFQSFISTDFHSLTFYFFAIYQLLKILCQSLNYSNKQLLKNTFGLSLLCFFCSFFRFAYYPFTFLLPIFFIGIALWKYKNLLKYSIICLISTTFLVCLQVSYQYYISAPNFVNQLYKPKQLAEKEIYWENLSYFNHFPWNAFFRDAFFNVRQYLDKTMTFPDSWYSYEMGVSILFCISVIAILSSLFAQQWLRLFGNDTNNNHSIFSIFCMIGLFTILVNVFWFVGLSLYYPPLISYNSFWEPQNSEIMAWTFVMNERYFAVSIIFIQFFIFIIPFGLYHFFAKAISIAIIVGTLFYAWVIWYYPFAWNVYSFRDYKQNVRDIHLFIYEELPKILTNDYAVFCSDANIYKNLGAAVGFSILPLETLYKKLENNTIYTSKKIKVILVLHQENQYLESIINAYYPTKIYHAYFERKPMGKRQVKIIIFELKPS
jgi:hypothetical protein